jgi:excinuclease UvrABC nuclease subunit
MKDLEKILTNLPLSRRTPLSDDLKEMLEKEILRQARPVSEVGFPGIYFLLNESEIVYIGQSNSVHTRIKQHLNEPLKSFDSYLIIRIDSYSERILRERQLIATFKPYYNDLTLRAQGYESFHKLAEELNINRGVLESVASKYNIPKSGNWACHVASLLKCLEKEDQEVSVPDVQQITNPKLF